MHFYIKSWNLKWNTTLIYLRASRMSGWYRWRVSRHCHWQHIKSWAEDSPRNQLSMWKIQNSFSVSILPFITKNWCTTYETHLFVSILLSSQVVLDENVLGEGQEYLDVGSHSPSPDHSLLAYSVSTRVHVCKWECEWVSVWERGCVCLWVCVMYRMNAHWELIWDIQTMCEVNKANARRVKIWKNLIKYVAQSACKIL